MCLSRVCQALANNLEIAETTVAELESMLSASHEQSLVHAKSQQQVPAMHALCPMNIAHYISTAGASNALHCVP